MSEERSNYSSRRLYQEYGRLIVVEFWLGLTYTDAFGRLMAQSNLHAIDVVNGWIAGRGAA
jgi:hypothetical protein